MLLEEVTQPPEQLQVACLRRVGRYLDVARAKGAPRVGGVLPLRRGGRARWRWRQGCCRRWQWRWHRQRRGVSGIRVGSEGQAFKGGRRDGSCGRGCLLIRQVHIRQVMVVGRQSMQRGHNAQRITYHRNLDRLIHRTRNQHASTACAPRRARRRRARARRWTRCHRQRRRVCSVRGGC